MEVVALHPIPFFIHTQPVFVRVVCNGRFEQKRDRLDEFSKKRDWYV
jgi:hypothetical protein